MVSTAYSFGLFLFVWSLLKPVANFSIPPPPPPTPPLPRPHPLVVVMAFDGFRYDYPTRGLTPFLEKLARDGVSTDYLLNVFPTKTMTNLFSIGTGMWAETHGVLGNQVFIQQTQCIRYGYELFHYNDDVIPIWTLNELSGGGRHSGVWMWGGSEFEYQNIKPTFYQTYNKSMPWHERIDKTMEWLKQDEKPLNLLLMYFEQPDSMGHAFGVNSPQLNQQLQLVDEIIKYFLKGLKNLKLEDNADLIILSDHGMVDVDRTNLINITEILNVTNSDYCNSSPILHITTESEFKHEVYKNFTTLRDKLKTFEVYKREDIPERWHFKNNERNTDFIILAHSPYGFQDEHSLGGTHGYDNADKTMHGFFAAKGPHFKTNHHITSLNNIDVYALISYMLNLDISKLRVKPNGTLSEIITILNSDIAEDYKNPAKQNLLDYFIPLTNPLSSS